MLCSILFYFDLELRALGLGCLRRASEAGGGSDAYQRACHVDAAIADGGVVQPLWLGEAEESVA